MEDAGYDGVFVHVPTLEDFLDSDGVGDVGLAGFAGLAFVSLGGEGDGFGDAGRFFGHKIIISDEGGLRAAAEGYVTMRLCLR